MRAARDGGGGVPGRERWLPRTPAPGAPPRLVAFVGKRQYGMLFDTLLKRVPSGLQTALPPLAARPSATDVFVLTSPSGRAAVAPAERLEEYKEWRRRFTQSSGPEWLSSEWLPRFQKQLSGYCGF